MTLTETAAFTKKALIVGTIFFFIVFLLWGAYSYYMANIYKPPVIEEKPDLKFGVLPKPNLPETKTSSDLNYSLDTETGGLPENPPKIFKVYSIAQLATDLLALDRAKDLAGSLGFNKNPEKLTITEFRFGSEKGGSLVINLDTGNFISTKPLATDSASIASESRESFANSDRLAQQFKNYLAQKNLLKDQLEKGRTKISYNQTKDSADITLWQQNIDDYPLVTDTFTEGLIKATVVNQRNDNDKYLLIDYTHWSIDKDNFATYPIKTPQKAFEELQKGAGTIILDPKNKSVSITKVYLGYLLTRQFTPYLQPVYVFEGANFAAYVSALTDEYLEK